MSVLALVSVFGTLGVTAVMVGPRVIEAQTTARTSHVVAARNPGHQRVIELFGSMVARSRAILAVHRRGGTPFEELVLLLEDRDNPGRIDPQEVGVVSHSRILQTLTFYTHESAEFAPKAVEPSWAEPEFCESWRASPERKAVVIASGLSDVQYEYEQLIQGETPALRITFTWAADSADGSDMASIVVGVSDNEKYERDGAGDYRDAS